MDESIGLGPLPGLDAALAEATGAAKGGVFGDEAQAADAAPGDLLIPRGPDVAAPTIHLKDEDLPSGDSDGLGQHEMSAAVPGSLDAVEEDDM
eukprot:8254434-Alexandrium_andersonii.AAC.1